MQRGRGPRERDMASIRIGTSAIELLGTIAFALGAGAFGLTAYWTFTQPMNPDEMEHLHATYLILHGLVPYTDFWQNHAPLLWLLLAPLMAIWPEHASICYAARALGLAQAIAIFLVAARIALLLGDRSPIASSGSDLSPAGDDAVEATRVAAVEATRVAAVEATKVAAVGATRVAAVEAATDRQRQRVWHLRTDQVRIVSILAVVYWGVAIPAELPIFRTDALMILCTLLAALFSLRAETSGRVGTVLLVGFFMGLGVSFSLKLLLLVTALPAATFIRDGISRRSIRTSLVYAAGCILGAIPLAAYLLTKGSSRPFYRWVVEFNAARGGGVREGYDTIWVPVLLLLFAFVAMLALGDPRRWRRVPGGTVRVMLVLTLLASVVLFPLRERAFAYYLAPVVALGVVFLAARTWNVELADRRGQLFSAFLGFGILATSLFPAVPLLWSQRDPENRLPKNLEFIQWMIDAARGQTVQCDVAAHPIYAYDLTPFYVPWQAYYALREDTKRSKMLRELLHEAGSYEETLRREEPAILSIRAFQRYVTVLQAAGLIDEAELGRVRETIQQDYRNFNDLLYVRRAEPAERLPR